MTETTATTTSLRAAILAALTTIPVGDHDDPEGYAARAPHTTHGPGGHQYRYDCALCQGETDTLTDAVMAAIGEQALDRVAYEAELNAWHQRESADAAAGSYALRSETAERRVAELEAELAEHPRGRALGHQQERDRLRERIADALDQRAATYDQPDIWPPGSQSPDAIGARAMHHAYKTAAGLVRAGLIPGDDTEQEH